MGIDVFSPTLEVASRGELKTWRVANDAAETEALVSRLLELKPALAVLEATGGYEFEVTCALQAAGLAVVSPRTAPDVARAMCVLAKTDAPHAKMQVAFARVLHQHTARRRLVKPLAYAELQRLLALALRRRQLVQMIAPEHQRMRMSHVAARTNIERVNVFLKTELGDSDADVAAHVRRHQAELAAALRSVPGMVAARVAMLLAKLRELAKLDRPRFAAMVGVEPLNGASGQVRGQRTL